MMTRYRLSQVGLGSILAYLLIVVTTMAVLTFIGWRLMSAAGQSPLPSRDLPLVASASPTPTAGEMDCEGAGRLLPLFTDASGESAAFPSDLPSSRYRFVRVSLDAFEHRSQETGGHAEKAYQLLLNLFPDVCLTAVRDRVETSATGHGFVWLGHVGLGEPGSVLLAVENDALVGTIRAVGALYEVRPNHNGLHLVRQLDPNAFPPD